MPHPDGPAPVREILAFWFGEDPAAPLANSAKWFGGGVDFDQEIRERWGGHVEKAAAGDYDRWKNHPRPALAYLLLTDQFPRNIHRDSPRAFAHDPLALECSLIGMEAGHERALTLVERSFFLMPLMHSEALEHQNRSVEAFFELARAAETESPEVRDALSANLVFAAQHRQLIARFGRFPHRNAALGRQSTPEELAFIEEKGMGF